MWAAIFWANGEMPHEIASHRLRHRVEFEADKFVERMSHPCVGIWWIDIIEDMKDTEGIWETDSPQP